MKRVLITSMSGTKKSLVIPASQAVLHRERRAGAAVDQMLLKRPIQWLVLNSR
ncbi:hypothetical protein V1278_005174 [Bradyrhizobium sp. AZCC 1577]